MRTIQFNLLDTQIKVQNKMIFLSKEEFKVNPNLYLTMKLQKT